MTTDVYPTVTRSGFRALAALTLLTSFLVFDCSGDDEGGSQKPGPKDGGGGSAASGGTTGSGGTDAGTDTSGDARADANEDGAAGASGGTAGQGGSAGSDANPTTPLLVLQRAPRSFLGGVFEYASYAPGARIVRLNDASVDAGSSVVCCDDPLFDQLDISSYDVSFDASEIVFAGRRSPSQRWALYVASISGGAVVQISSDNTRDYVDPSFVGEDRILFATNQTRDENAQYRDETERSVVLQLGTMKRDGSYERIGPSHLSHRRRPVLASDGRALFDQWDALGHYNKGDLMFVSPDSSGGLSGVREAFGKEGSGVAAAHWNAREIAPGRLVALAGPIAGTYQAGALVEIRLGLADGSGGYSRSMSEAKASKVILSTGVPLDDSASTAGVGRYADAVPLDAAGSELLVSWADGAVQAEALGTGMPSFGLYRFDVATGNRSLLFDDPDLWDLMPRLLRARSEPAALAPPAANGFSTSATLIGSMDVYTSSIASPSPGSVAGVRVIEGYSSEEGFPQDFGLTPYEGAAVLGTATVRTDGSWAALVPAGVPLRLQAVDAFGMSLVSMPVWLSGEAGGSLFCGGCHESRSTPTTITPAATEAIAIGPQSMKETLARVDRKSSSFTIANAVGVPWDLAIQPIFDAKCVSCHDGTPGPANPSWTVSDTSGSSVTWVFDLRGNPAVFEVGGVDYGGGFPASYFSLLPPLTRMGEAGHTLSGTVRSYVEPGSARTSHLIQKLNPLRVFPPGTERAFDTGAFPPHAALSGSDLDANQFYLLVMMADNGGQFYARENKP